MVDTLGWWLLIFLNLLGYFLLRFGMSSRGIAVNALTIIEFIGGICLTVSFVLMFWKFGVKHGLILIPIFWFVVTPVVEITIGRIFKNI